MSKKLIPYSKQFIDKNDIVAVSLSLKQELITQGKNLKKLEKLICKRLKCKYAIACSSATAGLHMVNNLFKNKKFITSPLTFASTVSTVLLSSNKIDLVDIDKRTLLIDVKKIRSKNFDGIVNVLFSGSSENSIDLRKKFRNKIIIEDASHALGAKYLDGSFVGSCKYSDFSIFSLHPVKSITSGEGGIITTNSKKYYEKLKLMRSHGIIRKTDQSKYNKLRNKKLKNKTWYYEIHHIGFNYRLNEIQAALAISQFKKLNVFIRYRKKIALYYDKYFKNNKNIEIPQSDKKIRKNSSHHLYTIRTKGKNKRDILQTELAKKGVGSQVHYIPIHKLDSFKKKFAKIKLPNTDFHFNNCLSIPNFYKLDNKKLKKIINSIQKITCES
jgi:dTDP-4-amino-4,6-dideoxygalactose transaminase